MPEYVPAEIVIGGKMKRALLPELLKEIKEAHVSHDYGDTRAEPADEAELLECVDSLGHLCFHDEGASNGEFFGLEAFLHVNNIPFTRKGEGGCEFDSEVVEFRRDMERPDIRCTNYRGECVVGESDLEPLLRCDCLPEVKCRLRELIRADLPDLPPFQIVD